MGRKKLISDEDLLAHARQVFMDNGAYGTTKQIAVKAGISEAAIFKRYPTKAKLFLAAMAPPNVDTTKIIASEIQDPREALVETGKRLLSHFRTIIPAAMHLMTNPTLTMTDVTAHMGDDQAISDLLETFLAERHQSGQINCPNPKASAGILVASIHSLALYEMMEMHGGQDMDHAVPFFVDALWTGLAPLNKRGPEP